MLYQTSISVIVEGNIDIGDCLSLECWADAQWVALIIQARQYPLVLPLLSRLGPFSAQVLVDSCKHVSFVVG